MSFDPKRPYFTLVDDREPRVIDLLAPQPTEEQIEAGFTEMRDLLLKLDVADIVAYAAEPLVLDDPELEPVTAAAPVTPRFTSFRLDRLTLPDEVRTAIGAHAASAADGFEVVGRLLVDDDGVATGYRQLDNTAARPGKMNFTASWPRKPGIHSLLVHSHPAGGKPSEADIVFMRRRGLNPFAIYDQAAGKLQVYKVTERGYRVVPVAAAHTLTASAAGMVATAPQTSWFRDPGLDGVTPLTVDDGGRVYGHLARWDSCHRNIDGVCAAAPSSATGYAYFLLKSVVCADGGTVPVGTITLDTTHAATELTRFTAGRHYDDTGVAVADVTIGEDQHGIWIAGALRAGADASAVRKLDGATLSGDWRRIGDALELVGVLAVAAGAVRPTLAAVVAAGDGWQATALTGAGLVGQETKTA